MKRPALVTAIVLAACARQPVEDPSPPANVTIKGIVDTTQLGSGSGTATCPSLGASGAFVASDELGPGSFDLAFDLAIDANGNIAVARNGAGVVVLSPKLSEAFSFGFGTRVAFDASGNLFVAGSFTHTIDLGLGPITPTGNIDVFVAEIDATGKVIFAKALGLCGADLTGMAIDRARGKIAISGSAMGTVVIDATGAVMFSLGISGKVAFDVLGNLVVAGATGSTGFVTKVDFTGAIVFTKTFTATSSVGVRALAIGPSGEIVFGGNFSGAIELFGVRFEEHSAEVGITFDTFLAKLDTDGNVVFVTPPGLAGRDVDSIAIDLAGNIVVSGDDASGQNFGRLSVVSKLAADGSLVFVDDEFAIQPGEALAVAVNACGAIFVGDLRANPFSAGGGYTAMLFEIAP